MDNKVESQVVEIPQVEETTKKGKTKVLGIIINVVLVIAILFAIFVGFTAYVSESGSGVPTFFGYRPFSVQTDSMADEFYSGDMIIDKVVSDPADLEVGDVITFWTIIDGVEALNSHRITEITDYGNYLYFNTKGDNNSIEDSVGVHQNDIVGVYLFKIPNLGTVIDFLSTGTGFLIVIVVPVFIFFVFQIIGFFKALFAYQKEKMRLQMITDQKALIESMNLNKEQAELLIKQNSEKEE